MLTASSKPDASNDLRVLVVDDEEGICKMLARDLRSAGFRPIAVTSGADAIRRLDTDAFDVVVSDMLMPEVDGIDVLRHARSLRSPVPVVMITAYGNIESAVNAMKEGASDFITKPYDPIEVRAAIQVAHRKNDTRRKETRVSETRLVGSNEWLEPFTVLLNKIAKSNKSVLLVGETGTGKSAVAREVARLSSRSGKFVELNCAAIPETLLEARLFGTVKGAFTDAEDAPGLLEAAAGGTLFLDEIGELKLELQAKLLHVLQEKTFCRVGATNEQRAEVRFIAATNRDLEQEVDRGTFRRDLFFRLNALALEIPALRNRPTDVPILLEHFRSESEDPVPAFSDEAIRMLMRYEWPGNIRELKNLVDRFGVFFDHDRSVRPEDLEIHVARTTNDIDSTGAAPIVRTSDDGATFESAAESGADFTTDLDGQSLDDAMNAYSRAIIVTALRRNKGNKSKTSRELKMKRTTLIERCHKLDISDADVFGDASPSGAPAA